MLSATTFGGWAAAIAMALEHLGIPPEPVFTRSHLSMKHAVDPATRTSVVNMSRLMRLASDEADIPGFGLLVGSFMRPTSWHALGFSIWASCNLQQGFDRLVRYGRIFTTCGKMHYQEDDERFYFHATCYPEYASILQPEEYDALLASITLTCRHLQPNNFELQHVELPHAAPADLQCFERMFKCPITFNAQQASLIMSPHLIKLPLLTSNPELARSNDHICEEYLARIDKEDVIAQVRYRMIEELPQGEPHIDQIANILHLSTRSLQRKLSEKGTNFKHILDGIRHELALEYLKQPHLSISEISYRLGFSHISNFSRAFKRWTGAGPTEYREKTPHRSHQSRHP